MMSALPIRPAAPMPSDAVGTLASNLTFAPFATPPGRLSTPAGLNVTFGLDRNPITTEEAADVDSSLRDIRDGHFTVLDGDLSDEDFLARLEGDARSE
jgi:hypothetical protein